MTSLELQKILADKTKILSLSELKQIVYEMKQDAYTEQIKNEYEDNIRIYRWYAGEQNAFKIVLDLLEHCNENFNKSNVSGRAITFDCFLDLVYLYSLVEFDLLQSNTICSTSKDFRLIEISKSDINRDKRLLRLLEKAIKHFDGAFEA